MEEWTHSRNKKTREKGMIGKNMYSTCMTRELE